ncbi:WD repeat-containing YMR102C-like isoform X1 [Olea europaea subsp. europaea]|uniref:WD repeat-containing YMR102C-like isoform X1 n=1 Tax=Olea europaea subsp. europaea TaxID=158383 RepID=A0A8S0TX12_OLEEU|nr:WD repeat-containing YMR102C-like isoform X1 [Olea europaea subsp. europaea]
MGSFCDNDEESQFFDASEHIAAESKSSYGFPRSNTCEYDVWMKSPQSITERRRKFIRWMGLSPDKLRDNLHNVSDDCENHHAFKGDVGRIMGNCGAVLRTSVPEDEFSLRQSSASSWSSDAFDLSIGFVSSEEFVCRAGYPDGASGEDGKPSNLQDGELSQFLTATEFVNASQSSPLLQQINENTSRIMNKMKDKWLSRLHSMRRLMSIGQKDNILPSNNSSQLQSSRVQRVRVHHCQKRFKELSALFTGQDIQAHEGSILTMKFSLDGQYLASAGEDKFVRIWQVVEDERSDNIDIPDADPSCIYFSVNRLSELAPLMGEKDEANKFKNLGKTSDSACIIFPPKVFRILEKPLQVFQGHDGEILDLSWSTNNCLLSSSVDKTVRLWRVGVDRCLKVFVHSDYVTCIQFNPVNDDYFISGSIDGKVRIWTINGCQVVDWAQIKDIITAVSYHPNGQGGIIGLITGTCRFFNISDDHIQLGAQMCLTNKKSSCKRITGFQFSPQDPSKVLVACTDSQVRILDGTNVIGKYRGLRNSGNQISALFTSDGKHIVSAFEDSNVYVWNYIDKVVSSASHPKAIRSFECFSSDASVAIPWSGMSIENPENRFISSLDKNSINSLPFSASTRFFLSQEFLLESNPRGSATWPEEKLPVSIPRVPTSPVCRSQYKLFKNSYQSSSSSHLWGLVIVTAGWDGRIRTFHNYGLPIPL